MQRFWRLELFGNLQARRDDLVVSRFKTHKTAGLLGFLAFYHHRAHPREALIAMLWPDVGLEQGRPSLSVALSSLRHQLEPPGVTAGTVIAATHAAIRLNPDACATDVAEFEALVREGDASRVEEEQLAALQEATALYRGPLLVGHYEEWCIAERERMADLYIQALRRLVRLRMRRREHAAALDSARRACQTDPLREELRRDLMALYVALDQPSAAIQEFRDLERSLKDELGIAPAPATVQLAREIETHRNTVAPPSVLPPTPYTRHPTPDTLHPIPCPLPSSPDTLHPSPETLPPSLTRFFGRERELARLQEAIEAFLAEGMPRLISLTGPGGTGKTRLSLEAAARASAALDGAVWQVALADVDDAARLLDAVFATLRLEPRGGEDPLPRIAAALARRPALLVLDNLEQLGEAGALEVQRLLAAAPRVVCLVTSRQRLNLEGEREFRLRPLPVPDTRHPTPETLLVCESVRLFVDRAQAVKPDYQVTAGSAAAIAELCRRLEGVPLAIELAASRAQMLTPAQMVAQMAHPLDFLVSRKRGVALRQQTVRAAVEWSWRLLAPDLQRLFASLAVFRGRWSLSAVEAVCEDPLALDGLAQLAECSLLTIEELAVNVPEPVFAMLETLRSCAEEHLDAERRVSLMERHADHYRGRLKGIEETSEAGIALLSLEDENLRVAVDWIHAHGSAAAAVEMAVNLAALWERLGRLKDADALLARALTRRAALGDRALEARLVRGAGWIAYLRADYGRAAACHDDDIGICREIGDREGETIALNNRALTAQAVGAGSEARRLYEASLALARELGDVERQAARLSNMGMLATREGQYAQARADLGEALAIYRRSGNRLGAAACLCNLGEAALRARAWAEAEACSEESLRLFDELDERAGIAHALTNLAEAAFRRNDLDGAMAHVGRAIQIGEEVGVRSLTPPLLEIRARVELQRGEVTAAAASLAAAEVLREDLGLPRSAAETVEVEVAARRLAPDILAAARAKALSMVEGD